MQVEIYAQYSDAMENVNTPTFIVAMNVTKKT
jgi:hypothetical protein